MKKQVDRELAGIDIALRRAAMTAKKLADKNGTPYVIVNDIVSNQPFDKKITTPQPSKQL